MPKRKTVSVELLKSMVNEVLLNGDDYDTRGRSSLTLLLEKVLMGSGNYRGFRYLSASEMLNSVNGTQPGINAEGDTTLAKFTNTDGTRVCYL